MRAGSRVGWLGAEVSAQAGRLVGDRGWVEAVRVAGLTRGWLGGRLWIGWAWTGWAWVGWVWVSRVGWLDSCGPGGLGGWLPG